MGLGEGFTIAQHEFGSPLALRVRIINNYVYGIFEQDQAFTPPTRDPNEYARELEQHAFGVGERWVDEWEPALRRSMDKLRAADFASMSDARAPGCPRRAAAGAPVRLDDPRLDQPVADSGDGADRLLQPGDRAGRSQRGVAAHPGLREQVSRRQLGPVAPGAVRQGQPDPPEDRRGARTEGDADHSRVVPRKAERFWPTCAATWTSSVGAATASTKSASPPGARSRRSRSTRSRATCT